MSYTVNGSGHGVDNEQAQEAFRQFVRALDAATDLDKHVDGWADPTLFSGSIGGGHAEGTFSLSADQVRGERQHGETRTRAHAEREDDPSVTDRAPTTEE